MFVCLSMYVCPCAAWRIKEKHVIANLTYIVHVSLNKDLCTHLHAYSALPKQPRVFVSVCARVCGFGSGVRVITCYRCVCGGPRELGTSCRVAT